MNNLISDKNVLPIRQWLGPDNELTQRIPTLPDVVEDHVDKSGKKWDLETVLMVVLLWAAIAGAAFLTALVVMLYSWMFGG